jgi:signal transduction histidine kinase
MDRALAGPAGRVRLLLVGGGPEGLQALEPGLGALGHEVVQAGSGAEALGRLMSQNFSLVLVDVRGPSLEGFDAARLLRSRSRHTPLIFLTDQDRSQDEALRDPDLGPVDYLIRPFAPHVLSHKVGTLVELQRKTRELAQLQAQLWDLGRALGESERSLRQLQIGLEERVRERTAELESHGRLLASSNRELAEFAGVVSHDLQEPLRTLDNHLALLKREVGPALSPPALAQLSLATETARRLRRLISDLLAYSRVESQAGEVSEVDCNELLREVLEKLNGVITDRGASVSVDILPRVRGRSALLGRLFQNLIENAIKFCESRPMVEVGADWRGSETLFWVKDNGIGIGPLDRQRIFKVFQRLHSQAEYPGTGMGLALCKKIVEHHGGTLWVESQPGKGSTFFLTLSADPNAELAAPARP